MIKVIKKIIGVIAIMMKARILTYILLGGLIDWFAPQVMLGAAAGAFIYFVMYQTKVFENYPNN